EVGEPRVIGRCGALHLEVRLERGRHLQHQPLTIENLVCAEPDRKAVAPVGYYGHGLACEKGATSRYGLPFRCPEHLCRRPSNQAMGVAHQPAVAPTPADCCHNYVIDYTVFLCR